MTKQERDDLNVANLNAYMDSQGIPAEDRDALPFTDNEPGIRNYAKAIGFKDISHPTPCKSLVYDLGRGRQLIYGDIGSSDEILALVQADRNKPLKIKDVIILHNYDYDGPLTNARLLEIAVALSPVKNK